MKKRSFTIVMAFVLAFAMAVAFSIPARAAEVYVVQRGDALWRIARDHGLTYTELAAYNNIANPHWILAGQRLYIPQPPAEEYTPEPPEEIYVPEPPAELTYYEVTVGADTPWPVPGVLSIPAGASPRAPVPGVILVHGSGPLDRDARVQENRPFLDIAAYLSENGIAVLRYDSRTFTHGGGMYEVYGGAFTVWEEKIEPALHAAQLMEADPRIGPVYLLGLSLGGMMAPRIQAASGNFFDGIIMLAGSPRSLKDIVLDQEWHLIELSYVQARMEIGFFQMMAEAGEYDFLRAMLDETTQALGLGPAVEMDDETIAWVVLLLSEIMAMQMEALLQMMYETEAFFAAIPDMTPLEARGVLINPEVALYAYYYRDIALHTAAVYLPYVDVPMLIMQGTRDFNIFAEIDFVMLVELLGARDNVVFHLYDGLSHLFMPSEATNLMEALAEYALPNHVYPAVLRDLAAWIHAQALR